ncbi:hypothetical protein D3C76_36750 [compost metagenome]
MYKLKAFIQIAALIDNTRSVIAPVGEISPKALTYAREKEWLNSATAPGHTMIVFSSARNGVREQTNAALASDLLGVSKWAYEKSLAGAFNASGESFRTAFVQQWNSKYSIYSVGEMINIDSNRWLPGVIEIRAIADDTLQYKLWFASETFEQQYDEYHIEVVPPVEELDVFFMGRNAINTALADFTHEIKMERVQAIQVDFPETFISGPMYEWYDPIDPLDKDRRIPTFWTPMVYGIAGNNVDAIKEALRDYILDNSTHTKDEWAPIFPEIFTSTEFVFVPLWGNYSIPNRELEAGLYSSVTNAKAALVELKRLVKGEGYSDAYLDGNGEVFGASHKAITVTVAGGPHNRDGIKSFVQRYYDYINVDSTTVDFMRMRPETRRFVLTLAEMLAIAESMTPDSAIPVKFNRLVREGILYVSCTLDRFQLIVASKYSYENGTISASAGEPSLG